MSEEQELTRLIASRLSISERIEPNVSDAARAKDIRAIWIDVISPTTRNQRRCIVSGRCGCAGVVEIGVFDAAATATAAATTTATAAAGSRKVDVISTRASNGDSSVLVLVLILGLVFTLVSPSIFTGGCCGRGATSRQVNIIRARTSDGVPGGGFAS